MSKHARPPGFTMTRYSVTANCRNGTITLSGRFTSRDVRHIEDLVRLLVATRTNQITICLTDRAYLDSALLQLLRRLRTRLGEARVDLTVTAPTAHARVLLAMIGLAPFETSWPPSRPAPRVRKRVVPEVFHPCR